MVKSFQVVGHYKTIEKPDNTNLSDGAVFSNMLVARAYLHVKFQDGEVREGRAEGDVIDHLLMEHRDHGLPEELQKFLVSYRDRLMDMPYSDKVFLEIVDHDEAIGFLNSLNKKEVV